MASVTLNVKISSELKERIRQYSETHETTLGAVVEELVTRALDADEHVDIEDIDNQHTEEKTVDPLSATEIKALRKLLKKKK